MDELRDERQELERAVDLLRKVHASRAAEAVRIIEDVIYELNNHDCDDFASDCDCSECDDLPDMRGVKECLAFGLAHIIEKYGESSMEAKEARDIIESK